MRPALRHALTRELDAAAGHERAFAYDLAFAHLERAHILSQRFTLAHAGVHVRMLRIGWKRRRAREILGQSLRTLAALAFSRIWVPLGNTGGTDVSAFRVMPMPADLQAILSEPRP